MSLGHILIKAPSVMTVV